MRSARPSGKRKGQQLFWGKGDSSKLDDNTKATLDHLRRMEETRHIVALTPDMAHTAVRAVEFYQRWESVLAFGTGMKNVALLVGALLTIYWVTEGYIVEHLRDLILPGAGPK